jgi:hypothetical protein
MREYGSNGEKDGKNGCIPMSMEKCSSQMNG